MRRRNGLSRPFTTPQISAWLALFVTIVQFLLAISPLLTIAVSIPATLVFMFLVIGSLYYGAKAQTVDPIDRRLRVFFRENPPLHDPYPPASKCWKCLEDPPRDPPTEEETKQCWICDTQVADHSMHCKFCNKCVGRFDHHCIWLNTCIGEANYIYFYRTLIFIFLMELSHLVIQVILIVDSFTDGPTNQRAKDWLGAGTDIPSHVILFLFIAFNLVSLSLIGQLLMFHIKLQKQRLTTYQYIVKDHKERRELAKREGELEARRISEMETAHSNGESLWALRLRMGGCCRSMGVPQCDPLDLLPPPPEPDPEADFAAALGPTEHHAGGGDNGIVETPPEHENGDQPGVSFVKVADENQHNGTKTADDGVMVNPTQSSMTDADTEAAVQDSSNDEDVAHENGGQETPTKGKAARYFS